MKNLRGKEYHIQIGEFDETVYRVSPNYDSVQRWINNIGSMKEVSDYNILLTGSYPHEHAKDVDIVFNAKHPDDMNPQDLEKIFLRGMEAGLLNEGVFFDMNASSNEIRPIELDMFNYQQTGDVQINRSLTYGPAMIVNGEIYKDYSLKGNKHSDYIFDRRGPTPSKKQMHDYMTNKMIYSGKYNDKPVVIKERDKIYGWL